MKQRYLHIYLTLLASLLVSCSTISDEEIIQEQDKMGVNFTLSMNSVGAASRSLSQDMASQYETTIDQDKFCVLAYTVDGKAHEVTIFSMKKISDGTYQISGELKGNHDVNKVMILVNCEKNSDPTTTPLNTLNYSYKRSDFNPENPKSYIPMWGVKKLTTPLKQGTSTNIGTINLLRAMAKIQVSLSKVSVGCELTQVALTHYNDKGACLPGNAGSVDETTEVTGATIPGDASIGSDLPFYQMDDKSYVIYLPEYKNKGNQYTSGISVNVKDINGVNHTKTIAFGKYNSGAFANEHWDILRNHYYAFSLRLEVAADGDLNLEAKTEKYAEFELSPVYGD